MICEEEKIIKDGEEIVLRCLRADEAETVLEGFKKLSGETRFLSQYPEEINVTAEQEREFIEMNNSDKAKLLIGAFVGGQYAGNCYFAGKTVTRRTAHRAGLGIAIFQQFSGRGLGTVMLEKLLKEAKRAGFEQMELDVVSGNERAIGLYKKLGFAECGRIPDGMRFDDGTSFDRITMYKKL